MLFFFPDLRVLDNYHPTVKKAFVDAKRERKRGEQAEEHLHEPIEEFDEVYVFWLLFCIWLRVVRF